MGIEIAALTSFFGLTGAFALVGTVLAAWMALFYALVRTRGADLIGFGVAVFWMDAASRAATLIEQPAPWFRWNGAGAALAAAIIGVLAIRVAAQRFKASGAE